MSATKPLWLVIHVLLFVYWLGADLGVYYSSRFVVRPDLSKETRAITAKIMDAIDLSPRVCLVLIFPSGVSLMAADPKGVSWLSAPLVIAAWVFALAWLYMVVTQYRTHAKSKFLTNLDYTIRYTMIVGLIGVGLYTVFATEPFGVTTNPKWLGGKVILYGIAIAGGLGIRFAIKPFAPAFGKMMKDGSTPEVESVITRSMARAIPYVWLIWIAVTCAAILGIWKPGAHLS